jgi:HEAT repeat protein
LDPALSLQLAAWISKGSRELKLDLLAWIESEADPAGGPALRMALLDDSQEVAARAARAMGKTGFTAGSSVLLKIVKIRERRFPGELDFPAAVCRSLGELGSPEGLAFLEEAARKKTLLRGRSFPLPIRLEAIQALAKINRPEAWHFLEELTLEKNQAVQETIDKIIRERSGLVS